jgi:hypothetical protein
MDWVKWHQLYETEPSRLVRLKLVQQHLSDCMHYVSAGAFKVVSICAGDGRDIIGALSGHKRRNEARVRLVEINPGLVETGRKAAESAGLAEQIEFSSGDATMSSAYSGIAPADLVIACGVFGNVREQHLSQLVSCLPQLCQTRGYIVWTHFLSRSGLKRIELIRGLLQTAGFVDKHLDFSDQAGLLVATQFYAGKNMPLPDHSRLFEFNDPGRLEILARKISKSLNGTLRRGLFLSKRN